jgi:formamidopyrimidine-DNA glycosylase
MPEVCEVALTAEILNAKMKGKTITGLEFFAGRYGPERSKPKGYDEFIELLPMKVCKIDSKGKFLWFDLVNTKKEHWYVWNTFGMTGKWSFKIQKFGKCRITTTSDKLTLYYSDMRNFGTFKFSNDKAELDKKILSLSPDFLKDDNFDLTSMRKYKKSVMSVLTDQKKVGSGIGNYLIAEILYFAKISPHRKCNTLTDHEIKELTYYIKFMIKLCYLNGGSEYMGHLEKETARIPRVNYHPDIQIKGNTDKFLFTVYQQKKDPLGNKVKAEKGEKGRTIYWVPDVQK